MRELRNPVGGRRNALENLATATVRRREAQEEWERLVREAVREHSLRQVAPAAGVSHARVGQIANAREEES